MKKFNDDTLEWLEVLNKHLLDLKNIYNSKGHIKKKDLNVTGQCVVDVSNRVFKLIGFEPMGLQEFREKKKALTPE